MKQAMFICLALAIILTFLTPVTEFYSSTLNTFFYWSSIILYIISVVLIVIEEKKHGWPYQD